MKYTLQLRQLAMTALAVAGLATSALAVDACPCGGDHALASGNWEPLSSVGGVLQGGNYYLDGDTVLEHDLTIASGATVHLCLNDCVLTGTGAGSVITLSSYLDKDGDGYLDTAPATLFLTDKAEGLTTRYGNWEERQSAGSLGELHYTIDSNRFYSDTKLEGGILTGGTGTPIVQANGSVSTLGGGINVRVGATLHMLGGTIAGNCADTGGGVMCSGVMTMDDGLLTGNFASFGGGINNDGLLVKSGGEVSDNLAEVGAGLNNLGQAYLSGNVGLTKNLGFALEGDTFAYHKDDCVQWRLADDAEDATTGLYVANRLFGDSAALRVIQETGYVFTGEMPSLLPFDGYAMTSSDADCFTVENQGFVMTKGAGGNKDSYVLKYASTAYRATTERVDGGTLKVSPTSEMAGERVSIVPTAKNGYLFASVSVVDQYGQDVALTPMYSGGYSFLQPVGGVTITPVFKVAPPFAFTDVAIADWFYDGVVTMYDQQLMQGTSEEAFAPYALTTRGMLTTLLYRLDGAERGESPLPFLDVAPDSYCADAVAWGSDAGIVNGYSPTSFAPNNALTRADLAVILHRYAQYAHVNLKKTQELVRYNDQNAIGQWAAEAACALQQAGVMQGDGAGNFNPSATVSRGELSVVLMRFLNLV